MAHKSVRQLGHCPAGWWAGLRNYYPLAELGAVGRLSYLNHHRQQKLRSVLRVQPTVLLVLRVTENYTRHKEHVACQSSTCH